MSWYDDPVAIPTAGPAIEPAPAPGATAGQHGLGGARRVAATALLAVGLLVLGGVAVVNAADPTGSAAPNATQPSNGNGSNGSGGTAPTAPNGSAPQGQPGGHARGDCPNMGNGSGSGSGSSGGSSAPSNGTSSPSTNT
jgi:hypothetical protein